MHKISISKLYKLKNKEKYIENFFNNNQINIEFLYLSDFIHTQMLRETIRRIFKFVWLNEKQISRIILITDEMNNNAIEYWSKTWEKNKLRLNLEKKENSFYLNIEVEDTWNGSKPKTALEMETLRAHQLKLWYREHRSIRWRWLFMIIINIVDRLYFRDTSTWWLIVWIKKYITN